MWDFTDAIDDSVAVTLRMGRSSAITIDNRSDVASTAQAPLHKLTLFTSTARHHRRVAAARQLQKPPKLQQ